MARKNVDEVSDGGADGSRLRRRYVRRDVLVNAVFGAVTGLLALAVMPPLGIEWRVELQVAVAAALAVSVFAVASLLFVSRELVSGVR